MCTEKEKKEIWEAIDCLKCSIDSLKSLFIQNVGIDPKDEDIEAIGHWINELEKKI